MSNFSLRRLSALAVFVASVAFAPAQLHAQTLNVFNYLPNPAPQTSVNYDLQIAVTASTPLSDVRVSYTLPANTVFVSAAVPAGMQCTVPVAGLTGTVACSVSFATRGTAQLTVTVRTDAAGHYNHKTDVTYSGGTATSIITAIVSAASLDMVWIDMEPRAGKAGAEAQVDFSVRNLGANNVTGATFNIAMPAGAIVTRSPSLTCSGRDFVACALPTLTPYDFRSYTLFVQFPPAAGTVRYAFYLAWPGVEGTHWNYNVPITARDASLAAQLTAAPRTVASGDDVTLTMHVTNSGADESSAASIGVIVPPSLTVRTASSAAGTCAQPALARCDGIIVPAHGASDVTFVARAANTDTVANISGFATSPTFTAKSVSAAVTIGAGISTPVTALTSDRSSVSTGSSVTYTVKVTNAGPSDARTVVTDVATHFAQSVAVNGATGFTNCAVVNKNVRCEAAALAAGASAAANIVMVAPATEGTVSANATTTASNATAHTAALSTPVTVSASRNISVRALAPPQNLTAGQRSALSFEIANTGGSDAMNVTFDAQLTPGLSLESISATKGMCVAGHCTIETLARGGTATVTVNVAAISAGMQAADAVIACDAEEDPANDDHAGVAVVVGPVRSRAARR